MSFLNSSAHQKFVAQCDNLISDFPGSQDNFEKDKKTQEIKADVEQLKKLADAYLQTFARLPGLSREYNLLQKRIRINLRKLQISKAQILRDSKNPPDRINK